MKNAHMVGCMAMHLSKSAERINMLAADLDCIAEDNPQANELFVDMLLSELEQVQKLSLSLTQIITDSVAEEAPPAEGEATDSRADSDGSVFAEGELQSVIGQTVDNPAEPDAEKGDK